ncbi:hypothetical protein HYH03_002974 [Edaphochlamys debaryana]|uniref:Protein kinase domain-containing protein n=1 Tax=Edaphochlamys debaryana TaxID=47281 RepID=A0A835YIU9_9CHLO|nr:hypothetical protein HYH03_002974 [Edaphochlamys debaryana]|eukprot:KAG2499400.1 hypothetical protein HYH03_002974 [Edaphochlamys debaryana]
MLDQEVSNAVLVQDIVMLDWDARAAVRSANLTISGPHEDPAMWPVLDLAFLSNKLVLAPGVALTFKHVTLLRWRAGPYFQFPGIDLIGASTVVPPDDAPAPAWGHVILTEMCLVNTICLAPSVIQAAAINVAWPPAVPGRLDVKPNSSQEGCVADPSAKPSVRCYPMANWFGTYAVYCSGPSAHGPVKLGYLWEGYNMIVRCHRIIDDECVARYGSPLGCFYALNGPTNTSPGFGSSLPAPDNAQPPPPATGSADGDSAGLPWGPIVGGVLGAVTAALLMGMAVWALLRAMRAGCVSRLKDAEADARSPDCCVDIESPCGRNKCRPAEAGPPEAYNIQAPAVPVSTAHHKPGGSLQETVVTAQSPCDPDFVLGVKLGPPDDELQHDPHLPACRGLMSGEVKLLPVVLGKGTFGKVYQGLWNGQRVAVKRLDLGLAAAGVRQQQAAVEAAEGGGGGRAPAAACAAAVQGRGGGVAAAMAADGCFAAARAEAGAVAAVSALGGQVSTGETGGSPAAWVAFNPALLQLPMIDSSLLLPSATSNAASSPPPQHAAAAAGAPAGPDGGHGQSASLPADGPEPSAPVAPYRLIPTNIYAWSTPSASEAPCERMPPPCGGQPPRQSRQSAPAAVSLMLAPGQQQDLCPQAEGKQNGDALSLPVGTAGTLAMAWSWLALAPCPAGGMQAGDSMAFASPAAPPAPQHAVTHGRGLAGGGLGRPCARAFRGSTGGEPQRTQRRGCLPPALRSRVSDLPPAPRPRLRGGLAALFQEPQALPGPASVLFPSRSQPQPAGMAAVLPAGDQAAAAMSTAGSLCLCKSELRGDEGAAAGANGNQQGFGGAGDRTAAEAHAQGVLEACLLRTFVAEVEVMARLHHPNVIRLLAASLQPPHVCLVMELAETSLEHLLYGRGPGARLPLDTVLHIGVQICSALAYLHPTVVHRDLKPANVLLVNADSATPTVKLADFGLSSLQSTVRFTRHAGVGKAAYMAPETMHPHGAAVSHHVDMYAVGIILYELLAGQRPWAGMTMVQIAIAVVMHEARPPLERLSAKRCPRRLYQLIRSCWEADPLRRPAAAEMLKALLLQREDLARAQASGGTSVDAQCP